MTADIVQQPENDRHPLNDAAQAAFYCALPASVEGTDWQPNNGIATYWMRRAYHWYERFTHAHQGNVEAEDILREAIARAEKAEQRVAGLDIRDHALQDMRHANGKLIALRDRLQVELAEAYRTIEALRTTSDRITVLEAELVILSEELGVTDRQRRQAEVEREQFRGAVTHWALEGKRWESEATAKQTEVIQLSAERNALARLISDLAEGHDMAQPLSEALQARLREAYLGLYWATKTVAAE